MARLAPMSFLFSTYWVSFQGTGSVSPAPAFLPGCGEEDTALEAGVVLNSRVTKGRFLCVGLRAQGRKPVFTAQFHS